MNRITITLNSNENVHVKAYIKPIEQTLSNFHEEWKALRELNVTMPEKEYPIPAFRSFIPQKPVSLGECWQIDDAGITELLQQLNPEPNLDMHINSGDSNGLWACLRAYNDKYADIQIRIHAEFKLEDGWFTPSQFAGNIIIDRIQEDIVYFKMAVPEGTVNFDVNWYQDNEDYAITDAGFCSQMELCTTKENDTGNIEYREQISKEEAEQNLRQCFYRSEKINWVPPYQAVQLAEEQLKLIHVISVDGPLKDEAC